MDFSDFSETGRYEKKQITYNNRRNVIFNEMRSFETIFRDFHIEMHH